MADSILITPIIQLIMEIEIHKHMHCIAVCGKHWLGNMRVGGN